MEALKSSPSIHGSASTDLTSQGSELFERKRSKNVYFFLTVILYTIKFDNYLQNICLVLDTWDGASLAGRCACVVDKYVIFYDT